MSEFNKLLPTGTNTNTDKELTELMLKIPREKRNIRLDLYCIVYFFDRLVSENKEPIDQKQYLSAISLAEKSVQSITNLVKNKPVIFDQDVFLKQGLNINGWYQEIPEKIKDITTAIHSSEDRDLHDDMIKKFKKHPDIQNYLLSLARLKILDQQSSNQDRTEEEQKALDDYNNFVAKIKKIPEIKAIWDNHQ